jgi:hypothetical protein
MKSAIRYVVFLMNRILDNYSLEGIIEISRMEYLKDDLLCEYMNRREFIQSLPVHCRAEAVQ